MTHGPDPVYVLRGSQSTVTYLKYLSDDILYSGDQDGFIYIWEMKSKRQITKMTAHPGNHHIYSYKKKVAVQGLCYIYMAFCFHLNIKEYSEICLN
jgi:WD40 repeat protein